LVDALIKNGRVDPSLVNRRIPLGRMGTPEEMAEAIFHLASPAARAMVGELLLVDGGGQAFGGSDDASIARGVKPTPTPAGRPVVVIAGADSRIGAAVADLMAQDGARLLLLDQSHGTAATPSNEDVFRRTVDVTDRAAVDAAIAHAHRRFARIDALVNALDGDVVASGAADWSVGQGLDRHVTGAFHTARAVGRVMLDQGHGAICNVVSAVGESCSDGAAAASAALAMFSRTLACEWGGSGIRTNALAIGPVDDIAPALMARMPLQRSVTADEVAAHVRFLITPSSAYVNGAVVTVDGGLGIYAGPDLRVY
jgi:NAD(P)-dependent dehydrogenase (short-subunit alcohol dehydrogenase family)